MPLGSYLRRVDLFKELPQADIAALFKEVRALMCAAGAILFTPDEPSEKLFVLKKGRVELYRLTRTGKRLVTRRIEPGTIFGEIGLLGQTMEGCFAEATEDSVVCVVDGTEALRTLRRNPDVTLRILQAVARRLRRLEGRLEQASFSPVRARLASFLLSNADRSSWIVAGYTHSDIGDTIGAVRQTITTRLHELERLGLLRVSPRGSKQVRLVAPAALEEMLLNEGQARREDRPRGRPARPHKDVPRAA